MNKNICISIITPLYNTPEKYLAEMIESVEKQSYGNWELCMADASDSDQEFIKDYCTEKAEKDSRIKYKKIDYNEGISVNSNVCADMASGEYIGILDHDDLLHTDALKMVVREIEHYGADFVYSDEAKFSTDINECYGEAYKPDFGMDELRAHNYICHFNVFSKKLFDEIGGYRKEYDGSQDHDLVLRLCERAQVIRHIPEILYYWRVHEQSVAMNISAKSYAVDAGIAAVQDSLVRMGEKGKVRSSIKGIPRYKTDYEASFVPEVYIVILSEDIDMIQAKMSMIEQTTDMYPVTYVILDQFKHTIFKCRHLIKYVTDMSITSLKNLDNTGYFVLYKERTVVLSPNWLQEMLILAQRSGVGCVGIKETSPEGQLLHTRVIFDGEKVRVPYYGHMDAEIGYEAELTFARSTSMLSGGVLLFAAQKLDVYGDGDIDLTDYINFTLRLFMEGYINIFTPFASSITDIYPEDDYTTSLQVWKQSDYVMDPFYNYHIKGLKIDDAKDINSKVMHNEMQEELPISESRFKLLMKETADTLVNEGPVSVVKKTVNFVKHRNDAIEEQSVESSIETIVNNEEPIIHNYGMYKDVLFISGCGAEVPHPHRYRVTHQKEQLESRGIHCDDVFYINLSIDMVRYYNTFVFYRTPYTDVIGDFIHLAKEQNKAVIFDVDDLVIDVKYTNQIPYVINLNEDEKRLYDDGVTRMGKTLSLCDAAITTTDRLAKELRNYVPEVFINRNTASEEMLYFSKEAIRLYDNGSLSIKNEDGKDNSIMPEDDSISIGYFSGSITHNADFELVKTTIIRLMKEYDNLHLCVVGELEIPEDMQEFSDRLIKYPFVDYRELPKLIKSVDINIAPIEESVFNEAKSENKWVEAALVKVVTVASDVGAFHEAITDGENGFLCDNTEESWYETIKKLIDDEKLRRKVSEKAYSYVIKNYITTKSGKDLAEFIQLKKNKSVCFVLPSTQISGGIMVAVKHCEMLREAGYNVCIIASNPTVDYVKSGKYNFPVVSIERTQINCFFEKMVATMWCTMPYVLNQNNTKDKYYLVQGFEPDFYSYNQLERMMAFETYNKKGLINYITISKWCQRWLEEDYGQSVKYAPDGLDSERFSVVKRIFDDKIRILIEGDSAVTHKNVDESFEIANQLDREKFEIWYISYNGQPKDWYKFDKFFHKVPYEDMPGIYQQCHILLKTSILESFSYPPLEMMATGGYVVAIPNDGNSEYLVDEKNCLLYERGNISKAIEQINRIIDDSKLRDILYENGLKTAKIRDWKVIRQAIMDLYK